MSLTPASAIVLGSIHARCCSRCGSDPTRRGVFASTLGALVFGVTAYAALNGDRFVARAEVVAEGYELYWHSLMAALGSNNLVGSFRLAPIGRITG